MTKVNLTQAAKLAGVGRSTLNRHIKEGKLSKGLDDQGKPYVETSELQRVYGNLSHDTPSQTVPVAQHGTPHETPEKEIKIARLEAELEAAKGKIEDQAARLDDLKTERDSWRQQAQTLALTPPAPETSRKAENRPAETVEVKLSMWERLTGKKALSGA